MALKDSDTEDIGLSKTAKLLDQNFEASFETERKRLLKNFDPDTNAKKIIKLIFKN